MVSGAVYPNEKAFPTSPHESFPPPTLLLSQNILQCYSLLVDFRLLLSEALHSIMMNVVRRIERGSRVNVYLVNHQFGRLSQNMLNFLENGKFTSNKHLAQKFLGNILRNSYLLKQSKQSLPSFGASDPHCISEYFAVLRLCALEIFEVYNRAVRPFSKHPL